MTLMLEAVYLDSDTRSVVGVLPRPSFRELFLCLESNGLVKVHDPRSVNNPEDVEKGNLLMGVMEEEEGRTPP